MTRSYNFNSKTRSFSLTGISEISAASLMLVISIIVSIALFSTFNIYMSQIKGGLDEILYRCKFAIADYSVNVTGDEARVAIVVYNIGDISCIFDDVIIFDDETGNVIGRVRLATSIEIPPGKLGIISFSVEDIAGVPFGVRVVSRDGYVQEVVVS